MGYMGMGTRNRWSDSLILSRGESRVMIPSSDRAGQGLILPLVYYSMPHTKYSLTITPA